MKCVIEIMPTNGYGLNAIGEVYDIVVLTKNDLDFTRILFEKQTVDPPHLMRYKVWLSDGRVWRTDNLYDDTSDPLVTTFVDESQWRNSEIGALRAIRDTMGSLFESHPSIDKIEVKHDA